MINLFVMNLFKFILVFILLSNAQADESWEPKINDLTLQFSIGGFGQTKLSLVLDKNRERIALISASLGSSKHLVESEDLSLYRKPDLNLLRVYVDGERKVQAEGSELIAMEELYDFKGFSVCVPYGNFKQGKRLGKEGYFRDILQIKFFSEGYKIINLDVAGQNLPTSPCTINEGSQSK